MRCPEWRASMSLRLDGLLPAEQEARLAAHLADCRACAQEWQAWQEVDDLFRGAPSLEPPLDLSERVLARLSGQPSRRALGGGLLILLLGVGALALVYLLPLAARLLALNVSGSQLASALSILAGLAVQTGRILATLLDGCRLLCWVVLSSSSLTAALVYLALAVAVVAAWWRLIGLGRVLVGD